MVRVVDRYVHHDLSLAVHGLHHHVYIDSLGCLAEPLEEATGCKQVMQYEIGRFLSDIREDLFCFICNIRAAHNCKATLDVMFSKIRPKIR